MGVLLGMTMVDDDYNHETLENHQYNKGVKHLCEIGITKVPNKYILPVVERPINVNQYEADIKLPVIDFAQLCGPNRAETIASLAHACEKFGFFQVVNHGISNDVLNKMKDVGRKFFDLPLGEREKYMSTDISSLVRYGTSFNQTKDGVFCWRDFLKLVCHPLSNDALSHWPSSPLEFREMGVKYARETRLLFLLLVEAILESLGLGLTNKTPTNNQEAIDGHDDDDVDGDNDDVVMKEMEKDGSQIMVVNCYPPCPEPGLTLGMPPHSDYGFLTLLLQDDVQGLQILFEDRWVTIRPLPNSFVVNVGDHLEIFSNGRYKSVLHRVLANSTKSRISVASLHSLPFTSIIRPSQKLINDKNPRRYKETDFAAFVNYITAYDSKHKDFLESRKLT